jgi:hypothetical protein
VQTSWLKFQSGGQLIDVESLRNELYADQNMFKNGALTRKGRERMGAIGAIEQNQKRGNRYIIKDDGTFEVRDSNNTVVHNSIGAGAPTGTNMLGYGALDRQNRTRRNVSEVIPRAKFLQPKATDTTKDATGAVSDTNVDGVTTKDKNSGGTSADKTNNGGTTTTTPATDTNTPAATTPTTTTPDAATTPEVSAATGTTQTKVTAPWNYKLNPAPAISPLQKRTHEIINQTKNQATAPVAALPTDDTFGAEDWLNISAAGANVLATIASLAPNPAGVAASAGLGATGSGLTFAANLQDEDSSIWNDIGQLALDLGVDAFASFPVIGVPAKIAKVGRALKSMAPAVVKLSSMAAKGAFVGLAGASTVEMGVQSFNTIVRAIESGEMPSARQWRDLSEFLYTITALSMGIKRGVTVKKELQNIKVEPNPEGLLRPSAFSTKPEVVIGPQNAPGVKANRNSPEKESFNMFETVAPAPALNVRRMGADKNFIMPTGDPARMVGPMAPLSPPKVVRLTGNKSSVAFQTRALKNVVPANSTAKQVSTPAGQAKVAKNYVADADAVELAAANNIEIAHMERVKSADKATLPITKAEVEAEIKLRNSLSEEGYEALVRSRHYLGNLDIAKPSSITKWKNRQVNSVKDKAKELLKIKPKAKVEKSTTATVEITPESKLVAKKKAAKLEKSEYAKNEKAAKSAKKEQASKDKVAEKNKREAEKASAEAKKKMSSKEEKAAEKEADKKDKAKDTSERASAWKDTRKKLVAKKAANIKNNKKKEFGGVLYLKMQSGNQFLFDNLNTNRFYNPVKPPFEPDFSGKITAPSLVPKNPGAGINTSYPNAQKFVPPIAKTEPPGTDMTNKGKDPSMTQGMDLYSKEPVFQPTKTRLGGVYLPHKSLFDLGAAIYQSKLKPVKLEAPANKSFAPSGVTEIMGIDQGTRAQFERDLNENASFNPMQSTGDYIADNNRNKAVAGFRMKSIEDFASKDAALKQDQYQQQIQQLGENRVRRAEVEFGNASQQVTFRNENRMRDWEQKFQNKTRLLENLSTIAGDVMSETNTTNNERMQLAFDHELSKLESSISGATMKYDTEARNYSLYANQASSLRNTANTYKAYAESETDPDQKARYLKLEQQYNGEATAAEQSFNESKAKLAELQAEIQQYQYLKQNINPNIVRDSVLDKQNRLIRRRQYTPNQQLEDHKTNLLAEYKEYLANKSAVNTGK